MQDDAAKDSLVRNLKNTSTASSKLLLAAKSLVSDPNAPNAKNSLANAARYVHMTSSVPDVQDQLCVDSYGLSVF